MPAAIPRIEKIQGKNLEFDSIQRKTVTVTEEKFKKLSQRDKRQIIAELKEKWNQSKLSKQHACVEFEVMDVGVLEK